MYENKDKTYFLLKIKLHCDSLSYIFTFINHNLKKCLNATKNDKLEKFAIVKIT